MGGEPVYGRVTAYDELINSVYVYVQADGSTELTPVLLRELDINHQLLFEIPYDFLGGEVGSSRSPSHFVFPKNGLFWVWAQGLGNLAKSDKQDLLVASAGGEIELAAEFQTPPDEENISLDDGDKVCGPWEYTCGLADGATVTYTITVDFQMLEEWKVHFRLDQTDYSTTHNVYIPSNSFKLVDGVWTYATDVYFATECSKLATVTLYGTDSVATDASMENYDFDDHWFILDLEDPTAVIDIADFASITGVSTTTGMATITFFASDTKCLDDIVFEFFVEKGEGDWDPEVEWGDEEFVIGEGELHEILGEATYSKAADNTTAQATMLLFLSKWGMDGATVTVNAVFDDCCKYGEGHEVEVDDEAYVDNVFLSTDIVDEDYGWNGVYFAGMIKDGDGKFWLPVPTLNGGDPAEATLTFYLWDKDITDATVTFGFDINENATGTATYTTDATKSFECTGYDVKEEWQFDFTLAGSYNGFDVHATSATLTIQATDIEDNLFDYEFTFWMDFKPASLTYVQGFTDGTAKGDDDFVQFVFDQDVNPDFEDFAATLTVISGGSVATIKVYNKDQITLLDMTDKTGFQIDTKGFTLPFADNAEVQLEVYAQDEHGNVQTTTLTGGIAENASIR